MTKPTVQRQQLLIRRTRFGQPEMDLVACKPFDNAKVIFSVPADGHLLTVTCPCGWEGCPWWKPGKEMEKP